MSRPDFQNKIRARIEAAKDGSVFVASDFADITENVKIAVCLSRLDEEKVILRVLRGVYYKPQYSRLLGEYIAPAPDVVAHAIARNFGWTIVPCGDTALNLLGLSTQVPAVWSYVSDGAYKEYSYDKTTIKFKRTTKKEISGMSPKTALVVQALKTYGKEGVTPEVISMLCRVTNSVERKALLTETQYATAWIYETIKEMCQ